MVFSKIPTALFYWEWYFSIYQLNEAGRLSNHILNACKWINMFDDEQPTVWYRHHLLVQRSVVEVIGPEKTGNASGRLARQHNHICSIQTESLVEEGEVLDGVIHASEEEVPALIRNRFSTTPFKLTSVAVSNVHLGPIVKNWVFFRLF